MKVEIIANSLDKSLKCLSIFGISKLAVSKLLVCRCQMERLDEVESEKSPY